MSEESIGQTMPTLCNNRLPRRVRYTDQQLEKLVLEDLVRSWHEQDQYIDVLESQATSQEGDVASLRESEERMRQQHLESTHREKVLVRRLATKEQEMQEYASQIAEFKAGQTAGSAALRSALLDPAVNLLLQRLRGELLSTRTRLEETQNELSAWKFTPDSNTGKRLMAKCRLLYQENEELGRMISSGRLAKLEGELALQKSFSDEVKKSQSELDEFLQDLDEDVEGMQSTIYYLQQELRKSKEAYLNLQQQKINQPSEVCNGFLTTNKSTLPLVKEQSSSLDIKVEAEPSSPLKDESVQKAENDDVISDAVLVRCEDEKVQEECVAEEVAIKEEPSEESGNISGGNSGDLELSSDEKLDPEEKTADLEESAITDSEAADNVDEGIDNETSVIDEVREETDDQDSQGELMIEVGSEPRDTEEDEELYEKNKEEDKVASVGGINGMTSHAEAAAEEDEKEEEGEGHHLRRKRAAPESSPNSSDEDSDDTPLIKKVRRTREQAAKSKV